MGTRSAAQVRSHAQKYFSKLQKSTVPEDREMLAILSVNLRLLKKKDKSHFAEVNRQNVRQLNYPEIPAAHGISAQEYRDKYQLLPS